MLAVTLSHDYGRFRLEAAFEAEPGVTALIGASGAGKSSVVSAISGMLTPQAGHIRTGDRVLLDTATRVNLPPHRRRVAQVFQDARLFPHLSVRDNLRYGWRRSGRRASEAQIDALINRLGIGGLLDARPRTLSGGESQRVALGRALLADPDVLLMDEPLAALDTSRKQEILPYFERLRDERQRPILYVTHALDEVARLADAVIVMEQGRIVDRGAVDDVLPRLSESAAEGKRSFVIAAKVEAHEESYRITRYGIAGTSVEGPLCRRVPGEMVRLRIRASDVLISLKKPEDISASNIIPAHVAGIDHTYGTDVIVRLETNGVMLLSAVTRKTVERLALSPGRPVFAIIKALNIIA
jgi:molybdate transport system ATP-binding protein